MNQPTSVTLQGAADATARFRQSAHQFLISAFTVEELTVFLRHLPGGDVVVTWLPSPGSSTSLGSYVEAAVDKLMRDGILDDNFFAALSRKFPRRFSEIAALEQLHRRIRPGSQGSTHAFARSEELIKLVDWIYARTIHRRRLGGLIGANVTCVILWSSSSGLSFLNTTLLMMLGFLLGHRFPAVGSGLRQLREIEHLCLALCALEALQVPQLQKQELAARLLRAVGGDEQPHARILGP